MVNCNTCAAEVFGDSVFCGSCGAIIDDSTPPPETPAEPTGPAFEPTQMIPVADGSTTEPAAPTPPAPAMSPPTPPPPAASRPAPQQPPAQRRAAGPAYLPEKRRSTIPLVVAALLLLGLGVFGFVLRGALADDSAETVDDSASDEDVAVEEGNGAAADAVDDDVRDDQSDDTVFAIDVPEGFRLYEGACFAAAVPDSWTISEDSGLRSYGRRTAWARGDDELFVDTSPLRDETVSGREAADEQLNNRTTATSGLIEESGRDDMWSYTYTRSGAPAIAIYFVEERGFGVVGSSRNDADAVVQEARQVARSIQVTNPAC